MKTIVDIPPAGKRGNSWTKHLTGVNTDETSGCAFTGDFLTQGGKAELEEGSMVLDYREDLSSRGKLQTVWVTLYRVEQGAADDGCGCQGLRQVYERDLPTRKSWALEVRDTIAGHLRNAAVAEAPVECDECETSGRNCLAHQDPPPLPSPECTVYSAASTRAPHLFKRDTVEVLGEPETQVVMVTRTDTPPDVGGEALVLDHPDGRRVKVYFPRDGAIELEVGHAGWAMTFAAVSPGAPHMFTFTRQEANRG